MNGRKARAIRKSIDYSEVRAHEYELRKIKVLVTEEHDAWKQDLAVWLIANPEKVMEEFDNFVPSPDLDKKWIAIQRLVRDKKNLYKAAKRAYTSGEWDVPITKHSKS